MRDQVFGAYVHALKHELEKLKTDMLTTNFIDNLYGLGKLQGKATGLITALEILEQIEEERNT